MKALRRLRRAARAAEIQDVPVPSPGPGEVLLAVSHCGVCGSDLHAFLNHRGYEGFPEQFTFGHEFSGIVENLGSGVSGWRVGDRAVVVSVQGCFEKKYLIRLPEGMDMVAAALAEPLSVADHCVSDCAKTGKGELVAVSGPGIIG